MRVLGANILRVVRGAGAPHDLLRQMRALEDAMFAHWEADRTWPLSEISAAVWVHEKPDNWDRYGENARGEWYAERTILSGALRYVAGELIGPPVQASRGSTEVRQGIRDLERLRQAERERWLAAKAVRRRGAR